MCETTFQQVTGAKHAEAAYIDAFLSLMERMADDMALASSDELNMLAFIDSYVDMRREKQ